LADSPREAEGDWEDDADNVPLFDQEDNMERKLRRILQTKTKPSLNQELKSSKNQRLIEALEAQSARSR